MKVFAEKLKAWTEATQVLQSETDGADGHTYSLFQENSSAALQTPTDLKGFDMMTVVRRLAEQEHFAALAQLRSRISAITKFGADADNDPFVKEKDLIMDFSRLQAEASPDESEIPELRLQGTLPNCCRFVYKNAVDSRRAVWRVITSVEQKEKSQGEEQLASYAREYIAKVENELQKIREGVLALMDKKLVPSPCTDESKAFYYKMKGDYYRYLAEFATGKTRSKAGEDACVAYAEATKIAENDLALSSGRGAKIEPHGPDCSDAHGDSTVAVYRQGRRRPCCDTAGSACSAGTSRGEDSRDSTGADRWDNR